MIEKCGCKGEPVIIFCPLHEAAPEMLKALKRIERQLFERDWRAPSYISAIILKAERS